MLLSCQCKHMVLNSALKKYDLHILSMSEFHHLLTPLKWTLAGQVAVFLDHFSYLHIIQNAAYMITFINIPKDMICLTTNVFLLICLPDITYSFLSSVSCYI